MSRWGGRRAQQLVALTLATKGTTCHLCERAGADSADHDPPRSQLIAAGVPDPDDLTYLWPVHNEPCNKARKDKPITAALRRRCRALRLAHEDRARAALSLSPRFARRRADLLRDRRRRGSTPAAVYPPVRSEKNRRSTP